MFKTKTVISRLQESSQNALSASNKIVTDLTKANAEVEKEFLARIEQMRTLEEELEILSNIKKDNSKVINKINKFLQDED